MTSVSTPVSRTPVSMTPVTMTPVTMTPVSMTPVAGPPLGAGPAVVRPRWNTLQILKASRAVLIVLVVLLLITVIVGTTVHRDAMKTVGKDSAPSIIAAQHIKSALADMDADAVTELLEPAGSQDATVRAYEARRVEAAKALIAAAENITYGDSERQPIQTLEVGMGTYESLIQRARDLHGVDSSATLAAVLAAYRDAARLMDQTLLPAADALDHANNDVLERTYEGQSSESFAARLCIGIMGVVVLAVLAIVQAYLSHKTRRTFNPMLLFATLLTAALILYALSAMGSEQHELKVAKEDAFSSIRALWRARAVAYQANSEEKRSLLDPAAASEDQRIFMRESDALAHLPATRTLDQLVAAEASGHSVDDFKGYLADELNNITFPGEREAAIATLVNFERYVRIEGEIRHLEESEHHKQAIDMSLGAAQGQSNWAFEQFDTALGKTLNVNQTAFDVAVEKGLSVVRSLEVKAAVGAVLVSVLVFLGLAGRVREYE